MIIRKEQMVLLGKAMDERFISRCVVVLKNDNPVWVATLDDEAARVYIRSTVEYGAHCGIRSERALLRLIDLRVRFGFTIPLVGLLRDALRGDDVEDEDRLLENLFLALATRAGDRIPITLESDLETLAEASRAKRGDGDV